MFIVFAVAEYAIKKKIPRPYSNNIIAAFVTFITISIQIFAALLKLLKGAVSLL